MTRAESRFDLVIRGGTILDGTGAPPWTADLGIVGDTIAALARIEAEQGRKVLDATGLHVAPGFIDVHTHSDDSVLRYPAAESRVRQGITTEVTGNCGSSAAPLIGKSAEQRRQDLAEQLEVRAAWSDVGSYLRALEKLEVATNQALLLGQGTLRRSVVGSEDRPAGPEEVRALARAVEEGMDHGAFGLSTGLEYVPGIFTPRDEIVALARVVGRRGGLYASHMRNEEAQLLEAVDEAIGVARGAGVRLEISHLKAAGRPNWHHQPAALERIETARRSGVDVLADAYPYGAYSTGLTLLLPPWARDGGNKALLERLADGATRGRIAASIPERMAVDPGGPELIQITSLRSATLRSFVGRTLAEVSQAWETDAVEALLRLLEEEGGDVGYIGHAMSSENVERVLAHPLVMIGSDGLSMAPEGPAAAWQPHPRSYGTCARVLGHYARERRIFDLATAVRKMTSMPADQVGLDDRGRIGRGKKADLVIFDAAAVADLATFDDPHRYPAGITHVLVNGRAVVEGGKPTFERPGQVLRKAG